MAKERIDWQRIIERKLDGESWSALASELRLPQSTIRNHAVRCGYYQAKGGKTMRCLTVQQPWAHLIIHGDRQGRFKAIENRSRGTRYRGPLIIHAGKSKVRIGDYGPDEPSPFEMAFGALLGIVEVVDCVPLEQVAGLAFAEGPMCIIVANPRAFKESIPWRGQQGFFNVPKSAINGR